MAQQKLAGIQIARAVAALAVAYFHSWHVTMPFPEGTSFPIPMLRDYGNLGVNFFFAISGFVICLVVTSPKFEPASFAIRRAFRLYPLWIAASLIYLVLTHFLGRAPNQTTGFFLYSLTLLPTDGNPFYDIGWSLQHELAFYLLAAVVRPFFGLIGLAVALTLGLTVDHLFVLPWPLHQYFSYYGDFLAGVAAFALAPRLARFGAIISITAAVGSLWAFGIAVTQISMFLTLIGFLNIRLNGPMSRAFTALGDASYSIYLIHPLVFYSVYVCLRPPVLPPNWSQEPLRFGALALVCALSILSWKHFERAAIAMGNKIASRLDNTNDVVADDRGLANFK